MIRLAIIFAIFGNTRCIIKICATKFYEMTTYIVHSSPKTPLQLPPKFFVGAIKHLEKSEALFCIDKNEVKGNQQFIMMFFILNIIRSIR